MLPIHLIVSTRYLYPTLLVGGQHRHATRRKFLINT